MGCGVLFTGSIKASNQAIISEQFEGDLKARDVLIGASGVARVKPPRSTRPLSNAVTYDEIEIQRVGQVQGDLSSAESIDV